MPARTSPLTSEEIATLVTVGQELVVPGERVDVTFEATGDHPVAAPHTDKAEPEKLAGDDSTTSSGPRTNSDIGTG